MVAASDHSLLDLSTLVNNIVFLFLRFSFFWRSAIVIIVLLVVRNHRRRQHSNVFEGDRLKYISPPQAFEDDDNKSAPNSKLEKNGVVNVVDGDNIDASGSVRNPETY